MTLIESFSLKGGIVEKALFECFEFLLLRLGLDCDEKQQNEQQNARLRFFFFCGSRALFMGLQVRISANFSLKLGFTVLFTYLKIILLQYFLFSIFSF